MAKSAQAFIYLWLIQLGAGTECGCSMYTVRYAALFALAAEPGAHKKQSLSLGVLRARRAKNLYRFQVALEICKVH